MKDDPNASIAAYLRQQYVDEVVGCARMTTIAELSGHTVCTNSNDAQHAVPIVHCGAPSLAEDVAKALAPGQPFAVAYYIRGRRLHMVLASEQCGDGSWHQSHCSCKGTGGVHVGLIADEHGGGGWERLARFSYEVS